MVALEPGELRDSESQGLTSKALETGVQGAQGRMTTLSNVFGI